MNRRTGLWTCAVMLLTAGANPIQAAWCNVIEVCWPHKKPACPPPQVTRYYYAPPATTCCATPCCQPCQQYQARSYYEPVTTYQTKTYYEPITTYKTSYYYEPVTSYRTSYYYDPCSCGYIAKSCPVTSYSLKAQTCPVQSFVERCTQVPVTTYRQSFYWEPVNPCPQSPCATQPGVSVTPGAASPPGVNVYPGATQPGVSITPGAASPPGVNVYPSGPSNYTQPGGTAPGGSDGFRQPLQRGTDQPSSSGSNRVRLERVVALPSPNVEGQVVRADYAPEPEAQVLFISADRKGVEQRVTANREGEFRATLAAGNWLVYTQTRGGQAVMQKRIQVGEATQQVTLLGK